MDNSFYPSLDTAANSDWMEGRVRVQTIALAGFVMMAFLQQLFLNSISALAYMVVLVSLTAVFVVSKQTTFSADTLKSLSIWWVSFIVMWISFFVSDRLYGSLLDVVTLSCGIVVMSFFSHRESDYQVSLKLILIAAAVFAAGVLLQRFVPSAFSICLRIIPGGFRKAIIAGTSSNAYNGFATNVGFSAGYICIGILALLAALSNGRGKKGGIIAAIVLFTLAFLLTGKRGPALFLLLTVILCNLIPVKGRAKVRKYWYMFVALLVAVVACAVFQDVLVQIPLVQKLVETIQGVQAGEDVSSMRFALWAWAIELFLGHPLFGIGWGTFKTTVVGNVSYMTVLDTHNIYLQLLCETGIIGFVCIVSAFLKLWNMTKKAYCKLVADPALQQSPWKPLLYFSFLYQSFFLLYGFSGNVLYDQYSQIIYMFACCISLSYRCNQLAAEKGNLSGENSAA